MSSSYHPQTDGQTERVNQCLEAFLRCTVHSCPKEWHKWLPLAKFWYNTTYHSALQTTPFEVLYGHPPRHLGIYDPLEVTVPNLASWLTERNLLTKLMQQQLLRGQQRMKNQSDKNRSEREFSEGDLVYLKLQPHIQSSVAFRSNHSYPFGILGLIRFCPGLDQWLISLTYLLQLLFIQWSMSLSWRSIYHRARRYLILCMLLLLTQLLKLSLFRFGRLEQSKGVVLWSSKYW